VRLVVADLLTNLRLGEWRTSSLKWELERDRPGTITGSVIDPAPATLVNRPTAIYCVYPNGTIPWGGICWGIKPTAYGSNEWKLEGAGFTSLLDFRIIRDTIRYQQADQAAIVLDLLARAQLGTNAALGWAFDVPTTGIKRDENIKGEERKSVLKYLTDWCDNINGYDFRVEVSGNYERTFRLLYPRDSRHLRTVHSRPGVTVTKWEDDLSWVANNFDGTGSDGLAWTLMTEPQTNWPRLDTTYDADSASYAPTLVSKVRRFAELHRTPLVEAEVTVTNGTSGVDWIGDDIRLIDTEVSGRDEVFQLIGIDGYWNGAVPTEVWKLEQTLRQEDV